MTWLSRKLIVALALVAGALLAAGCGSQPNPAVGGGTSPEASAPAAPSPAPVPDTAGPETGAAAEPTLRISYADGQVSGETGRVPVALGTTVTVLVRSDVADEVHLHGYDKTVAVPAGGSATLRFSADIPGVFELELHEAGITLASLEVS